MKINPLYFALLLIVALLFAIYQLGSAKAQLRESKNALVKVEAMAEEIDALKRAWDNPKTSSAALDRLLEAPQLKPASIQRSEKRGLIVLESKSADLKATNYFFAKLFNSAYILQSFEVKRLDDETVTFSVEIKS
jgi:hypothetical protein